MRTEKALLSILLILASSVFCRIAAGEIEVEFSPIVFSGRIMNADYEDGSFVNHVFINIPQSGSIEVEVKGDGIVPLGYKEDLKTENPLFEYETAFQGEQKVVHLRIYSVRGKNKAYYTYKKFNIRVKTGIPLVYSSGKKNLNAASLNPPLEVKSSHLEGNRMKSFIKIVTDSSGIYKVSYDDIKKCGITPETVDPSKIGLYTPDTNMIAADTPAMFVYRNPPAVPIQFYGDSDASFEKNEYILFFGKSVWGRGVNMYDGHDLYNNPYTDYNVYDLVLNDDSPARANFIPMSGDEGSPELFTQCIMHYDSVNPLISGYGWVWRSIYLYSDSADYEAEIPVTADGSLSGEGSLTISFFQQNSDTFSCDVYFNGSFAGVFAFRGGSETVPFSSQNFTVNTREEGNILKLVIKNPSNINKRVDLCEVSLTYSTSPSLMKSGGEVFSKGAGPVRLNLQSEAYVRVAHEGREYFGRLSSGIYDIESFKEKVFISKKTRTPVSVSYAANNILDDPEGCDMILITGDGMGKYAMPYKFYREREGIIVKIYEMNDIYNAFTMGMVHPAAIKSMLYTAFSDWKRKPRYLLLLGSGTYDYKNRQNTYEERNVVPVYEQGYRINDEGLLDAGLSKCVDKWFCQVSGSDELVDVIPGRITALNGTEAGMALQKIMDYETRSPSESKNRVMMVADDEYSSRLDKFWHDIVFMNEAEANSGYLSSMYDIEKVYLSDYWGDKQTSDHWNADPGFKRNVLPVIKETVEEGVGFGIFYGHGSYYTLTHEHVLLYPDDIDVFKNIMDYPVFLFGTCQAGQADNDFGSIASEFQKLPYSGFSGCIASTRAVTTDESFSVINSVFSSDLINRDFERLGDYFLSIINNAYTSATSHQLYGDPAMMMKDRRSGITIIPPDSVRLGQENTFTVISSGLKGSDLDFAVYLPSYTDSHDWMHTYPYSYIYYPKTDGILFKTQIPSADTLYITVPFPDTLEEKKYVGKFLATALCETDTAIYSAAAKPLGPLPSVSVPGAEGLSLQIKYNGTVLGDTALLPPEYTLDIDVSAKNGVYSGNVSEFMPYAEIHNEKSEKYFEFLSGFSYIPSLSLYRKSIAFKSSGTADTLKLKIYDNALMSASAKIIIEHKQGIKGFDDFTLYPNPFDDAFNISFRANGAGYGKTVLVDENGAVLEEFSFRFNSGFNTFRRSFTSKRIIPGVYLVRTVLTFYGKNGDYTIVKKAVKKA